MYNVAAHTQGDMSRDMCRGSSLYWSSVLVRVFSANSSDKLNLRQLGVDTTIEYSQELSRLSEEDLESDVVFWIDAGYVCDHSPLPVPFRTSIWLFTLTFFRTGNKHAPLMLEDEVLKYLWRVVHVCAIIWYSCEVLSGFERTFQLN